MLLPQFRDALATRRILDVIRRNQILTQPPIRVLGRRRPSIRVSAIAVNGAGADVARFRRDLEMARAVWGRCGIDFAEGGFTVVTADVDYPGWVSGETAPAALLAQRGDAGPNDIRLYYVGSMAGNQFQGRSFNAGTEPGYAVVSRMAHPNLFPHELGHLFLGGNEQHRDSQSPADRVNIMRSDVGTIEGFPQVDADQCTRALAAARSSRFQGAAGIAAQNLLALPGQVVDAFETSAEPGSGPVTSQPTTLRELLIATPDAVIGFGPVIVPQILMLLTCDPAPAVRAAGAAVLGRIGGFEGQIALMGALRDPDPTVRAAALRALAAIGSPIAQASIAQQVRVEPDPNVRALAHGLATGMQV